MMQPQDLPQPQIPSTAVPVDPTIVQSAIPVLEYDNWGQFSSVIVTKPADGELHLIESRQHLSRVLPGAVVGLVFSIIILLGGWGITAQTEFPLLGLVLMLMLMAVLIAVASIVSLKKGGRRHFLHIMPGRIEFYADSFLGTRLRTCPRDQLRNLNWIDESNLGRPTGHLILKTRILRWKLFLGIPLTEAQALAQRLRTELGISQKQRVWKIGRVMIKW